MEDKFLIPNLEAFKLLTRPRHEYAPGGNNGGVAIPDRIEKLHRGDMADFQMPRRYALVMITFNAFCHMLTTEDQLRCLGRPGRRWLSRSVRLSVRRLVLRAEPSH